MKQLKALTEERAKLKAQLLDKEQEARTHENEVTSLMGDLDASETRLRKTEILRMGIDIGAPLEYVWPCYEGGDRLCGACESCLRFLRAVRETRAEELFHD